jgi:PilZ domain
MRRIGPKCLESRSRNLPTPPVLRGVAVSREKRREWRGKHAVQTRRYPRYSIDRPVQATLYWEDHPIRKLYGRCVVLGEGGLGARLYDHLPIGQVVKLEIAPIPAVYATVRNACGTEHGFEFLYSRDGQRRAVQQLCARIAEQKIVVSSDL